MGFFGALFFPSCGVGKLEPFWDSIIHIQPHRLTSSSVGILDKNFACWSMLMLMVTMILAPIWPFTFALVSARSLCVCDRLWILESLFPKQP